jgi:hypothetical protein
MSLTDTAAAGTNMAARAVAEVIARVVDMENNTACILLTR